MRIYSRPMVAWPPTTVALPFTDFSKHFRFAWNVEKRCSIVGRRSRHSPDLRRLSRDHSATFFLHFAILLERRNTIYDSQPTVAWPPTTVPRPFRDFFQKLSELHESSKKKLFDSRPTIAWPPTTVAWPFSDYFKNFPNCLKRREKIVRQLANSRVTSDHCRLTVKRLFLKNSQLGRKVEKVVWQSANSRVTSDHCRVTDQQLFSKFCHLCWNVRRKLFDSRSTVTWSPTTVAWPFSDFFQKIYDLLETSKECCLNVSRR